MFKLITGQNCPKNGAYFLLQHSKNYIKMTTSTALTAINNSLSGNKSAAILKSNDNGSILAIISHNVSNEQFLSNILTAITEYESTESANFYTENFTILDEALNVDFGAQIIDSEGIKRAFSYNLDVRLIY